jgi:hypothetical protein
MSDEKNLILVMVATGKKPLSAYTPYTGESLQICEAFLSKVVQNSSSAVNFGSYIIYYINEENITYLIMTMPDYPKPTAIGCIESIRKEVKDIVYNINLDEQKDYGLDDQLKEKLKMKYEFFNENTEVTSEALEKLKIELQIMKDEVYKANEQLMIRSEKINEMENKAEEMVEESKKLRQGAIKVNKKESKRRIWLYIVIILVILGIIYGIICVSCGSFVFEC